MPTIIQHIRAKNGPRALQYWDRLGSVIVRAEDPEGEDIPEGAYSAIFLPPTRHVINPADWNAWLDLCIHMLGKIDTKIKSPDSGQEVSCIYMLPPGGKDLEIWIPTQRTGGATVSVDYTKPIRHITSGKEYKDLPAMEDAGYIKMGGCHSHNTMSAFFSGTDDRNETPQPGYHMVVGDFENKDGSWFYRHALSITADGRRFKKKATEKGFEDFVLDDFVGPRIEQDIPFSPTVMDLIDFHVYTPTTSTPSYSGGYGYYAGGQGEFGWRDDICLERECWGKCDEGGICKECGKYSAPYDKRPDGAKNLDKAMKPYYDSEGDLVGYIYPGQGGALAIGPKDMCRVQEINGWPDKGTPTDIRADLTVIKGEAAEQPNSKPRKTIPWNQRPKASVAEEVNQLGRLMDYAGIEGDLRDIDGAFNMLLRIRDWAMEIDGSPNQELLQFMSSIFEDAASDQAHILGKEDYDIEDPYIQKQLIDATVRRKKS